MKGYKWLIISIPLLLGGMFLYGRSKTRKQKESVGGGDSGRGANTPSGGVKPSEGGVKPSGGGVKPTKGGVTTSGGTTAGSVSVFPLRRGSKGDKVRELQTQLQIAWGLDADFVDGSFGKNTEDYVHFTYKKKTIDSQREIDGIVTKVRAIKADERNKKIAEAKNIVRRLQEYKMIGTKARLVANTNTDGMRWTSKYRVYERYDISKGDIFYDTQNNDSISVDNEGNLVAKMKTNQFDVIISDLYSPFFSIIKY